MAIVTLQTNNSFEIVDFFVVACQARCSTEEKRMFIILEGSSSAVYTINVSKILYVGDYCEINELGLSFGIVHSMTDHICDSDH